MWHKPAIERCATRLYMDCASAVGQDLAYWSRIAPSPLAEVERVRPCRLCDRLFDRCSRLSAGSGSGPGYPPRRQHGCLQVLRDPAVPPCMSTAYTGVLV